MASESDPKDNPSKRISSLQAAGSVTPSEAKDLERACAAQPSPRFAAAEPQAAGRQFPLASQQFLHGDLSASAYRRMNRSRAVLMGILFGILMATFHFFRFGWYARLTAAADWPWQAAKLLGLALGYGLPFGVGAHWFLIRPAVERTIALRQEAGPLPPIPAADAGQCPTCRGEEFKVLGPNHVVQLHYVLNPGLAFNELILGQRVVRTMKSCTNCGAHATDCPHCHRAVDLAHWSASSAFGNWTGLRCPYCGNKLPMLANALASVIRTPILGLLRLVGLGGRA
jgi:hypothetical protein